FYSAVAAAVPAIARIVPLDRCEALVPGPLQAPLAREITSCFDTMSRWLKDSKCATVLPPADEFWQRFVDDAGAPSGLQKSLCGAHENALMSSMLRGPLNRKVDRLRQTSCKSRNSGAWLTATPSLPELVLSDMEFRYAVRHRLGLAPHSNLPARGVCGASLDQAPGTFTVAPSFALAVTHRHNR